MKYYTNNDEVVAAESPPLMLKSGVIPVQEGANLSYMMDDFIQWAEVDKMTFRLYRASIGDFLNNAHRDVQAGMWVLNEGNDQVLRLGGNWPEDDQAVDFMTEKNAKIHLIMRTQHWFAENRPKAANSNSAWSAWIKRTRRSEPFIYLGES